MSLRRIAFWLGVIVGAGIGYAIGISLPEEEQQHLREEFRRRGEDLVAKAKEVGTQQARHWTKEAQARATEWFERAETHIPYPRSRNNGHTREM